MCGIVGRWHRDGRPVDLDALVAATRSMAHRGPDGEGYVLVESATGRAVAAGGASTPKELGIPDIATFRHEGYDLAFGHRRLAILDPTPAGHQPMGDQSGGWLVHSGEIYNYEDLARRHPLEELRSRSDTEVLLGLLGTVGPAGIGELDGMWAFAWWDPEQHRLVLSRDRYGMKPLHLQVRGHDVTFASEPSAIIAMDERPPPFDASSAFDFLAWGMTDHDERSAFSGIGQVPPGTTLSFDGDGSQARVLGELDPWSDGAEPEHAADPAFDVGAIAELLSASVRRRLRADVSLGASSSGGIDSSSIMSLAQRASDGNLQGFTSVPLVIRDGQAHPSEDAEREWMAAQVAAAAAGVDAIRVEPTAGGLFEELAILHRRQGAPVPSTSAYAQWVVTREAAGRGTRVLLDGQGGDEVFSGYPRAADARLASRLRAGQLVAAMREARSSPRGMWPALRAAGSTLTGRAGRASPPAWLRLGAGAEGDTSGAWRYPPDASLAEMMRIDLRFRLPGLLRLSERSSMAHGVEVRMPFLDDQLIALASRLPEALRVDGGIGKVALRSAMRGVVPDAILDRKEKLGFPTPERAWLFDERWGAFRDLLEAFSAFPFVDARAFREQITHADRSRPAERATLWRCASFAAWHAEFFATK